jgi:hypothetical protein
VVDCYRVMDKVQRAEQLVRERLAIEVSTGTPRVGRMAVWPSC